MAPDCKKSIESHPRRKDRINRGGKCCESVMEARSPHRLRRRPVIIGVIECDRFVIGCDL